MSSSLDLFFDLDPLFADVFGAQSDLEPSDKTNILARALESSGANAADSLMIGDRCHDILAARRTGATPLGAGCGYGPHDGLREAGAIHIASSPGEMTEWIGRRAHTLTPRSAGPKAR